MNESDEKLTSNDRYSFKDISLLKYFKKYLKPYVVKFVFIIALDFIGAGLFTIEPVIIRTLLNYLYAPDMENPLSMVFLLAGLDIVSMSIASAVIFIASYQLKKIGQQIIYDIRNDLFDHILSLSQSQLKIIPIGSYVTRVTNDTQTISSLFSDILPQILRALFTLLVIVITTFVAEGMYGFLYLIYIPIVFFISYWFRKKAKVYYRNEKNSISAMNSFLSEDFNGIKVVKTYGKENKMDRMFDEKNKAIRHNFLKSQYFFAIFYPLMYLLQMSCVIIIMAFGIPNVYAGKMLVGDFNLLYSYSTQFFQPIQTITQLMNNLQQIISSGERIQKVMNMNPEIVDAKGAIDVPSFKGKIEFRHVYFAYNGDNYVLKDISFVINKGEVAAFVGKTGSGKSTIISLISRQYEVNSGSILIDDIDVKEYSIECLRRNIGLMLQDVFLFSGDIEKNISLDDPDVSLEDVDKASVEVGLKPYIDDLKDGYNTAVSERGSNFSAGEKQLISFARTLVYKPSLVLLDEATANIDTKTENVIQDSLFKLKGDKTMIIVAHRLSTIKKADIIFVVDDGKIVESGDHQKLLNLRGNYYNLYRLQNLEYEINAKLER